MDDTHDNDANAAFGASQHPQRRGDTESGAARQAGHMFVSTSEVAIVAIDDSGVIRSCNLAAEKLLERPADQLMGTSLGFPAVVGETREIDVMLPNGGVRSVEMRVSTATWNDQRLYITALHECGVQSEPPRGSDTDNIMLAVTAHELDNPLSAITLAVQQLRQSRDTDQRQCGELIDRIDQLARHMQSLIRKLRAAARIDSKNTHTSTERVRVLEFLLERIQELSDRSRHVTLSCDPELTVSVDRTEFAQMLNNCLHNALIHGAPPIDLEAVQQDGWVDIRVRDHGPGVPEAFVPRLFQRYQRFAVSQHASEGSGLGLWITRGLAQAHGGEAWYETHEQQGACFCLRLPRNPPS
jgi:signal transduction histidine kinase